MSSPIKYPTAQIHVHKVVQSHDCTYETVYSRYGDYIDPETRMIDVDILKDCRI